MININNISNGMTIKIEHNIFQILDFKHVKPGKGPAFVRIKLKNLRTGANIEQTFNTSVKFEKANIEKKKMQFLYADQNAYNFMDMSSFEQIEIDEKQVGDAKAFLKENSDVELMFYENELLGVILPDKVVLKITKTEPAVKGNTTGGATKDAYLETGHLIKVPLFVEQGENVIVSTKDGKYDSRA